MRALETKKKVDIDELVQERRNSIVNALELRRSCTNPPILFQIVQFTGDSGEHYSPVNNLLS